MCRLVQLIPKQNMHPLSSSLEMLFLEPEIPILNIHQIAPPTWSMFMQPLSITSRNLHLPYKRVTSDRKSIHRKHADETNQYDIYVVESLKGWFNIFNIFTRVQRVLFLQTPSLPPKEYRNKC